MFFSTLKIPKPSVFSYLTPLTLVCVSSAFAQTAPAGYTFCANERATCNFSGTRQVAYGANGQFNYKTATASIACTNATFGDPIRNVVKACYYANSQPGSSAQSSSRIALSSSPSSISRSSTGSTNQITLQEGQASFCGVDGTVDSNYPGFTGSGFANTDNAINKSISWQVNATGSNPAVLEIRFANGSGAPRSGNLIINNGSNGSYSINLADTGAWSNWATERITVDLVQGANTIKFVATTGSGLANIDSLGVTGVGVSPGSCATRSSAPGVSSSSLSSRSSSSSTAAPQPTQCQAMGYATRSGRTGGGVNVTGGGNVQPIVVTNFADLQRYASDSAPRVIYIDGTVGSGWSGTSGNRLAIGSNKTIVGMRPGTQLRAPIHIKNSSNVIVRNLVIQGPGSNSDQAWDNLNIEGSSKNIWIDHNEFWDGQDGNADVVKGADNVTFTWNIFGYKTNGGHNFSNLVASSDNEPVSEGKLNITMMFNHFSGVAQRQPRCRYGNIHVVNNLFTRDGMASQNGVSAGKDCRILIENNHFMGIAQPIHRRDGGVSELRGNNIFEGTTGSQTGYGGSAFEPPYEYRSMLVDASQLRGMIQGSAGATLSSPTACK